jgi:hypothetical protein
MNGRPLQNTTAQTKEDLSAWYVVYVRRGSDRPYMCGRARGKGSVSRLTV